MVALLISGTVIFCTGVLTLVFGLTLKEYRFGETLMIIGAIVACTGLLLTGLALAMRELRAFASPSMEPDRDARDAPRNPRVAPDAARQPARNSTGRDDFLFSRDQPSDERDAETEEAPALSPPGWADEPPARPRPASAQRRPEASSDGQRRDVMFASRRREPPSSAERSFAESESDQVAPPPGGDGFDENWSQPVSRPRPAARPRPQGPAPEPARREEAVTVVKSGVVDSMAYSLYSDGSIEAQMPEGMVRFESIDELRAHLDQRA